MIEVDDDLLRRWPLPQPGAAADKEQRGSLLVVGGSAETPGAVWLAATAAVRAGAGKLAVAAPASIATGLALRLVEARVVALPETDAGGLAVEALDRLTPLLEHVDAVLLGPGTSDEAAVRAFARGLIARTPSATIALDALAINVACEPPRFDRPPVLTPHAGEMAHALGIDKAEVEADGERIAVETAQQWNAVVVLKGATTLIASPDGRLWRHRGGQPGLGTSGSGDVLAGIVAGLTARGADVEQAAVWAVALHSRAGERLAHATGPLGYLASELPGEVPRLMASLHCKENEP